MNAFLGRGVGKRMERARTSSGLGSGGCFASARRGEGRPREEDARKAGFWGGVAGREKPGCALTMKSSRANPRAEPGHLPGPPAGGGRAASPSGKRGVGRGHPAAEVGQVRPGGSAPAAEVSVPLGPHRPARSPPFPSFVPQSARVRELSAWSWTAPRSAHSCVASAVARALRAAGDTRGRRRSRGGRWPREAPRGRLPGTAPLGHGGGGAGAGAAPAEAEAEAREDALML